jgi:hypothetical protein
LESLQTSNIVFGIFIQGIEILLLSGRDRDCIQSVQTYQFS